MVDFTSKYKVPIEEMIAVAGRQGQAEGMASANNTPAMINSGLEGIQKGLQLTQQISEFKAKKDRARQLAKIMTTPDFQELDKQTGGALGLVMQTDPDKGIQAIVQMHKNEKSPVGILFNKATGQYEGAPGKPLPPDETTGIQNIPQDATIREYDPNLSSKPTGLTDEDRVRLTPLAKAISEYRAMPNQLVNARSGEKEKLSMLALEMNPNFDATNYQANQALIKGFTSGKQAEGMRRFDTAAVHLNTLEDKAAKIFSNPDLVNKLKKSASLESFFKEQTGNTEVASAKYALSALARELSTAYRGSGVTSEDDIKTFNSRLDPTQMTPDQFLSVGNTATEMMAGVIDSYKSQWSSIRSPESFNSIFLQKKPRVLKMLQKHNIDMDTLSPKNVEQTTTQTGGSGLSEQEEARYQELLKKQQAGQ